MWTKKLYFKYLGGIQFLPSLEFKMLSGFDY